MRFKATQSTGEIIRQLRVKKELSLREIASRLDMDTSFFSKIERNERKATRKQILSWSRSLILIEICL